MLPDLDVLAFRLNVAYSSSLGHRGASHSVAFALVLGALAAACAPHLRSSRVIAFAFVGLAAASHGLLDMFTNGGLGVAMWWPLSSERLFVSWRVIEASPLSLRRVFSEKGLAVVQSELLWVWLPAVVCAIALIALRR
jgi:inner membrane protein